MKVRFGFLDTLCRAADGAAAGADPVAGAAPAAAAAAAAASLADAAAAAVKPADAAKAADGAGANADGTAPPPRPYFPDGLPDSLKGASERETIDKLAADFKARPVPPAKPEDYKLELSPDLQKRFGDLKDDKVLPLWGKVAHKAGLSNQQYNQAFSLLYEEMQSNGLIEPPVDWQGELLKLAPSAGDPTQRLAAASQRVNAVVNWVEGLTTRNVLSVDEAAPIAALAANVAGVVALEKLARHFVGDGGLKGGGIGSGAAEMNPHEQAMRTMFPTHFRANG